MNVQEESSWDKCAGLGFGPRASGVDLVLVHLSICQHWVKIERFLYKYFQIEMMGVGRRKLYCDYEFNRGERPQRTQSAQMNYILHTSSYSYSPQQKLKQP